MPILLVDHTMNTQSSSHRADTQTTRPVRAGGWMAAAIAVHLLVTTMASAAVSCGETIERTRVTRLTHCVAQAIRELVDQGSECSREAFIERDDEPTGAAMVVVERAEVPGCLLGDWLLNLPPPSGC